MYFAWKIWYKKQVQARFTLANLCTFAFKWAEKATNKLTLNIKLDSLNTSVNLALKTVYSIDIVSLETFRRHMPQ